MFGFPASWAVAVMPQYLMHPELKDSRAHLHLKDASAQEEIRYFCLFRAFHHSRPTPVPNGSYYRERETTHDP